MVRQTFFDIFFFLLSISNDGIVVVNGIKCAWIYYKESTCQEPMAQDALTRWFSSAFEEAYDETEVEITVSSLPVGSRTHVVSTLNIDYYVGGYCSSSLTCNGAVDTAIWCNEGPEKCAECGDTTTWCNDFGGYCNWGYLNNAESSVCNGRKDGCGYMNENEDKCVNAINPGRWCTTAFPEWGTGQCHNYRCSRLQSQTRCDEWCNLGTPHCEGSLCKGTWSRTRGVPSSEDGYCTLANCDGEPDQYGWCNDTQAKCESKACRYGTWCPTTSGTRALRDARRDDDGFGAVSLISDPDTLSAALREAGHGHDDDDGLGATTSLVADHTADGEEKTIRRAQSSACTSACEYNPTPCALAGCPGYRRRRLDDAQITLQNSIADVDANGLSEKTSASYYFRLSEGYKEIGILPFATHDLQLTEPCEPENLFMIVYE